jgi:hypothetical protein
MSLLERVKKLLVPEYNYASTARLLTAVYFILLCVCMFSRTIIWNFYYNVIALVIISAANIGLYIESPFAIYGVAAFYCLDVCYRIGVFGFMFTPSYLELFSPVEPAAVALNRATQALLALFLVF